MKLVVAIVAALTAWLFAEQPLLRRWPAAFARLGFLPVGRRRRVAARREGHAPEWPGAFEEDGVEVRPPAEGEAGWMRIREADKKKRLAGVARVDARANGDDLELRAYLFPTGLVWAIGMTVLLVVVVLTLSPTLSGVVISAISVLVAAIPTWGLVQRARARAEPALDALAQKLEASEPSRGGGKKGGRRKKGR
ncbi:MAG TPA: hypothetical protein VIL20_13475 [Sandaracinaceae bacterium]